MIITTTKTTVYGHEVEHAVWIRVRQFDETFRGRVIPIVRVSGVSPADGLRYGVEVARHPGMPAETAVHYVRRAVSAVESRG